MFYLMLDFNCAWDLEVPEGYRILLEIQELATQDSTECLDYLTVLQNR